MGQVTVDYISTPSFARRPALWLKLMSDNRSTIAYSPSFGYDLAARRTNGGAASLDLSAWRVAGIGGDMVRADVLEFFAEHMAPAGFDPRAFVPSYGMAESTLAVTFGDLDTPVRVDVIDRAHSKLSRRAVPVAADQEHAPERTRSFVVCGRPLPGHEVVVRDHQGRTLGEREIGHVLVRGPSLMAGYFDNPEATEAVMDPDGFMDTGDMGYLLDGEIVITGRAKDLILHNGRNIWPQDIEWAVEQIEPLRSGDVAAFALEGTDGAEEVVVLVQCRLAREAEMEELRRQAAAAVHRSAGVECEIVLVPPRSLPFTSSGKLSRAAAKSRFLSGDIAEISNRGMGLSVRPQMGAAAG
jgi:fatty-acyl-CoA synthase